MSLIARLRDFVITKDDLIFSVVSYDTRGGVRSTLRYVPDENGERIRKKDGRRFKKIDFKDSYNALKEYHPEYISGFEVIIPEEDVKVILNPSKRLLELVSSEPKISKIFNLLTKAGIPESSIGITGSFLCGTQNDASDVDLIVYGSEWFHARDIIELAKKSGDEISQVSDELWQRIYDKRRAELTFDEFMIHDLRKGHRGMIDGTYFDLLFVREWDQIDLDEFEKGEDSGYETITARVTNDDFSFDSPAVYHVEHDYVSQVLSYTHTYAGQALEGEVIEARGKLEKAGGNTRLIVGTSREAEGEWIKSLTLLKDE
ncbi:MAG: DNA polymerase subunit beta [Halobacteriota archaeon]|nr:DNA polymerase subunit beta [Halobacteriota archaeon]